MTGADSVLSTQSVTKYFDDPVRFRVLHDINISVNRGEFVSVTGKSGCGKSTLLYVLSTMDTDYEGEVFISGEPTRQKSRGELARIRNEKIGFVFQFHYLLPEFTVLQNVMLPGLKLGKLSPSEVENNAMRHLETLGIAKHAGKAANKISGGEKQRVAIARALINDPMIIMGDEPTGNLDSKNSELVFNIFREISSGHNQSILVVTHDEDFARRTDRNIIMDDGRIVG
jgi:lipoprotein-releasing system ATP-binding protein